MISIKQVEAFYWTARLGTVHKAAVKLSITPSAATKRIQDLERLAIQPLFARQGTRLALTGHGRHFLLEVEEFLKAMGALDALMTRQNTLDQVLRIGITELTALTWFPAFAKRIKAAYPGLKLHPEVDLSAILRDKVLSGALDAVVIQDIFLPDELVSIPIQTVQYGWFCKPGLLPAGRPLSPLEVAMHPVIEQTSGSGLTALSRQLFTGLGIGRGTQLPGVNH